MKDFTTRSNSAYLAGKRRNNKYTIAPGVLAQMVERAAKLDAVMLISVKANIKWKTVSGKCNKEVYKETKLSEGYALQQISLQQQDQEARSH